MIVAKFGGTAVTPHNLHCIKEIVTPAHKCVVVSAIGREHPQEFKVTDLLKCHYQGDPAAWQKIADKYRRLVAVNGVDIDVDRLLHSAYHHSRAFDLGYCLSLGEQLSAQIVAAFLHRPYMEADQLIIFHNGRLARGKTFRRIHSTFCEGLTGVTGGFYGGTVDTTIPRQTFPRGGGDITGAIFAAATGSTLYENWTDVSGVCLADPKSVSGVATAPCLSYNEMRMLANTGAQVLHPDTLRYVQPRGIPIRICNYLNPALPGTLVSNCPSGLPLLLATEQVVKGDYHTTILFNLPAREVVEILGQLFHTLTASCGAPAACNGRPLAVLSCRITHNRGEIVTTQSILRDIYRTFSHAG